jgi:hypothetical protein
MAFDAILQGFSAPASTDLSGNQYCAVIFDTSANIALATSAKNMDGILQDNPTSGDAGYVAVNGIAKGLLGGSVTTGEQVQVGTSGAFVAFSSGVAVGKALSGGASGNIISILLYKGNGLYS